MSHSEVVEIDVEADAVTSLADDQSSDRKSKRRKLSPMYELWHFEPAAMRDDTHRGAQCLPCKHYAVSKGETVSPEGSCLADLPSILVHVKSCTHHTAKDRQRASAELVGIRAKKKPAAKRALAAEGAEGSNSSNSHQQGMNKYFALSDKPLSSTEQAEFEQACLHATVSGNMPLQIWDDPAFRRMMLLLRPQLKIPSRKTISNRILEWRCSPGSTSQSCQTDPATICGWARGHHSRQAADG